MLKYILLTFLIVGILFGGLALIGTYGPISAVIGAFAAIILGGTAYYKYTEEKDKCPHQK